MGQTLGGMYELPSTKLHEVILRPRLKHEYEYHPLKGCRNKSTLIWMRLFSTH